MPSEDNVMASVAAVLPFHQSHPHNGVARAAVPGCGRETKAKIFPTVLMGLMLRCG